MRKAIRALLAGLWLMGLLAGLPGSAQAGATCESAGVINVSTPAYRVQNNAARTGTSCIASGAGTRWLVTSTAHVENGSFVGYPSIYKGCSHSWCTPSSGLPAQVSSVGSDTGDTSWWFDWNSTGEYNATYDLWFDTTPNYTGGTSDGAELMVWLNSREVHLGGNTLGTTTIDGVTYSIWLARKATWNRIAYERISPVTRVTDLDLIPLIEDAVSRGAITPSWYWIDVEAGFEIWSGGVGLMTNEFSFDLAPPA
jgi:hypothetical protein